MNCIDFSASHHVVLSGSADRTAALWDVRAGKVRQSILVLPFVLTYARTLLYIL